MALPAGITPVTVTGKVVNNKGVAATGGTVTFRMPFALCDGPDHVVVAPGVWVAAIASDGTINTAADPMPAASSSGVSPAGWSYDITVNATLPGGFTYYRHFAAVIATSASFEQLLAAASPTPSPGAAYLSTATLGVTVAPLVAGKVPVEFLPPGGGGSGVESVEATNGTIVVNNTDPLNPTIGVGTGIPQASITNLTSDLSTVTSAAAAAQSTAAAAGTAAAAAQSTANAAYVKPGPGIPSLDMTSAVQTALIEAGTAYQKPGGGIPEADLATAVQALLTLAGTAVQTIPSYADPAAAKFGGHSCNVGVTNNVSTVNGEVWAARITVEPGNPINGVFTLRVPNSDVGVVPAAAVGSGGLNGFAVYAEAIGGGPGAKLADTGAPNTDDNIWLPTGKIDRPLSGITVPSVRTSYWALMSVRGYSGSPYFSFYNFGGNSNQATAQLYGKYRGGGFLTWPSTLDPATDLGTGAGFVLPIYFRS